MIPHLGVSACVGSPPSPSSCSTLGRRLYPWGCLAFSIYSINKLSCSVLAHTNTCMGANVHLLIFFFCDSNQEWELWSAVTSHLKGKLTDYLLTICLVAVSRGWQGETYCHQNFSLVFCNVPYQSASLQSRVKRTETQLHALCVQYMEGGNTIVLFTVHHLWMCLKCLLPHYESLVFPVSIAL